MKNTKLWKLLALLAMVFVAGGVVGGVATYAHVQRALKEAFDFDHLPDRVMTELVKRLALTPEQQPKVRAHVAVMAGKMKEQFHQAMTETGELVLATGRLVDQELTAEQRVIHAEMRREFREGMQKGMNITLPDAKTA